MKTSGDPVVIDVANGHTGSVTKVTVTEYVEVGTVLQVIGKRYPAVLHCGKKRFF